MTGKLDDGLTQALVKIHRDRHGQVDGVSFDFRHTDLDPDEWWSDAYSGLANEFRMRPSFWPFLWFPWFGEFSPAQVDESIDRELSEHPGPERSESDQRVALRREYTPDAFVERGDAVRLAEVKIARTGHGLHYKHDSEIRFGFVEILRRDGSKQFVEEPIEFVGIHSLSRGGKLRCFETIGGRVSEHFGVRSIFDRKAIEALFEVDKFAETRSPAHGALIEATLLAESYRSWKKKYDSLYYRSTNSVRTKAYREASEVVNSINKACLVGYLWAHAEAAQHMEPLALAALASRSGASRAGQASGARRRAKAAATWQALVKDEAIKLRAKHSTISQSALATEILFLLGEDSLPSHPIIVRYISKLERDNELPKRRN